MRLDHLLFKENQKALRSHDKNSGLSKESPEGVRVTLLFLCSKSLKSSATLGRAFLFSRKNPGFICKSQMNPTITNPTSLGSEDKSVGIPTVKLT